MEPSKAEIDKNRNKEIILMRKIVRQAKVHIVNKLNREAKKLRARHGTDKEKEKCNRKADKLISEIMAIKKVKDDEISKFGIKNSKSLKEVLEDSSVDVKVRGLTRIVFHKKLNEKIEDFRKKFPDYSEYFNKLENKSRKIKKDSIKDNITKKSENTVPDCTNDINHVKNCSNSLNKSDSNFSSKEENINNEHTIESTEEENNEKDDLSDNFQNHESASILRIKPQSHKSKIEKSKKGEKIVTKSENEVENNEIKQNIIEKKTQKRDEDTFPEIQMEQDNFFMTTSDQTYLSRRNKIEDNESSLEHNRKFKEQRLSDFGNDQFHNNIGSLKRENKEFKSKQDNWRENNFREYNGNKQGHNDKFDMSYKNKDFSKKSSRKSSFQDDSKHKGNFKKNVDSTLSIENLHPSWAARKKQQEILKEGFKGTKIVFNDD